MSYERLWERLLDFLNSWATARETGPGRVEVTWVASTGRPRTVTLVMSRQEWDDLVTIPYGDFDLAADGLRRQLLGLDGNEPYLVYRTYELVPSATPVLREDPEELRLQELARRHPEGFGRWIALDENGDVVDELRPPQE